MHKAVDDLGKRVQLAPRRNPVATAAVLAAGVGVGLGVAALRRPGAVHALYRRSTHALPESVVHAVGASSLLAPVRDALLRPGGEEVLSTVIVDRGWVRFRWTAPVPAAAAAEAGRGENIITRLIQAVVPEGGTAIDVGTFYGYLSVVMGLTVGPAGRVVAVEVDPAAVAGLRRNLLDNGLEGRTEVVEAAAGRQVGPATVTVDSLAERLGLARVDLLKIDVDGSDFAALRGAEATVERWRPTVVVEAGDDAEEIVAWLRARYPQVTDLWGGEPLTGAAGHDIVASTHDLTALLRR